jgi:undecaprenyl-diphosphatase
VLFVFLAVQVALDDGPLLKVDHAVRDRVVDMVAGTPALDGFMHFLADLGGPVPGGVAVLAAVAWTWRRGVRITSYAWAAATIAVLSAAVIGGKIGFGRSGPRGHEAGGDQWGWFPSGHSATSAVCYGTAALLVGLVVSPRTGRWVYGAAGALCAAIGFSLLWCDYHWLGDVLGAWALCGVALWALRTYGLRTAAPRGPPAAKSG